VEKVIPHTCLVARTRSSNESIVGFSKHMRPSARASRVGLSQKSSVLSSIDVFVLSVSPSIEKHHLDAECFGVFVL
jgi:hypothetical protein